MSKKKTKLYTTQPSSRHPEPAAKGLMERNPNDPRCYDWYNLTSAVVDRKGTISMRCAGVRRTGIDTFTHYSGSCSIPPEQPDYEKFQKAIDEAKE